MSEIQLTEMEIKSIKEKIRQEMELEEKFRQKYALNKERVSGGNTIGQIKKRKVYWANSYRGPLEMAQAELELLKNGTPAWAYKVSPESRIAELESFIKQQQQLQSEVVSE